MEVQRVSAARTAALLVVLGGIVAAFVAMQSMDLGITMGNPGIY